MMFFSSPYVYPPCGLYTVGHLVLFLVTSLLVATGLVLTRKASAHTVRNIVRVVTVLLWALEIAKILFVLFVTLSRNPNDFIPLYYCSLVLYAGLFASVGKGRVAHLGDVFLATGGIVGGVCFLICPNTSLPRYPLFHFISFHSFILHGLMVFLGLLLLLHRVYRPKMRDMGYYAGLVSGICAAAYAFNTVYDTVMHTESANLMFLSHNFPGTPIDIMYRLTGVLFPIAMWLVQATVPFLAVLLLYLLCIKYGRKTHTSDDIPK